MKMLEEGNSIHFISGAYGIDHRILSTLWSRYKKEGPVAFVKKKNCALTVAEKLSVISEYKEKRLSLPDIMLSHGVSRSAIEGWCRRYAAGGAEALVDKPKGRPRKDMGRPKKKKPEEITELKCLRYENERRVADKIYEDMKKAGFEIIYDDRNINAGVMFSDANLLGVPLRIVVSPKTLERNAIEFASRDKSFKIDLNPDNVVNSVVGKINEMILALTPKE